MDKSLFNKGENLFILGKLNYTSFETQIYELFYKDDLKYLRIKSYNIDKTYRLTTI